MPKTEADNNIIFKTCIPFIHQNLKFLMNSQISFKLWALSFRLIIHRKKVKHSFPQNPE
jgi:hypothetical protein